ncbi:hypothetical protein EYS14_09490 [Alteromonadaceae bacterium M269]|nr:hypothetical protein EYS14_09490 [Alteromonadaceae bacterium M269]
MKLVAEISLYPLNEEYIEPIKDFIARLNQYDALEVNTGMTSTTVEGDYQLVMDVVSKEMKISYEQMGQAIFVCKFINGDRMGEK